MRNLCPYRRGTGRMHGRFLARRTCTARSDTAPRKTQQSCAESRSPDSTVALSPRGEGFPRDVIAKRLKVLLDERGPVCYADSAP
eukprot:12835927-Alexandrium_andersonii.AAC.1